MSDVQNERTESRNRRRRRPRGDRKQQTQPQPVEETVQAIEAPRIEVLAADPVPVAAAKEVRPPEIEPPAERFDVYCVFHAASEVEQEPTQTRTGIATLRHLAVDRFGGATLYCDCLHNGPHQWPPSMQKLESAIELDQFLAASTSDA